MQIAFGLNNLGKSFLAVGEYTQAKEAFKSAVELMKCFTVTTSAANIGNASLPGVNIGTRAEHQTMPMATDMDCDDYRGGSNINRNDNDVRAFSIQVLSQWRQAQDLHEKERTKQTGCLPARRRQPAQYCFVARAALEIPECSFLEHHPDNNTASPLGYAWESAVILHNLALAVHLLALEANSTEELQKAIQVYDLSRKLLEAHLSDHPIQHSAAISTTHAAAKPYAHPGQNPVTGTPIGHTYALHPNSNNYRNNPNYYQCDNRHYHNCAYESQRLAGCTMLYLSILNNMGQLHHELQDYTESRSCVETMSGILTTSVTPELRAICPNLDSYILNAMLLRPPESASAA